MRVRLKRVYDTPARSDGKRVLIDRIWPRGLTKEDARLEAWCKEIAPSTPLRKWYNHEPAKWREFQRRYFAELARKRKAISRLSELAAGGKVTLVFAAKDRRFNNAVALKAYLEKRQSP